MSEQHSENCYLFGRPQSDRDLCTCPTVSPLPAGPVIVTEHAQPHAAQVRSIAQWLWDESSIDNDRASRFATELRAAADYIERMEQAQVLKRKQVSIDFKTVARDIDFAVDVTEPQAVRLERFEDILRAATLAPEGRCLGGCAHHVDTRECAARVMRPNYMGFNTSTFGCTLYQPQPREAPGTETKE